jgi:sulfite reductase (NADPH) hemoprotein beta-component
MPQRPWQPLDWRQGDATAPEPVTPGGIVDDHDGGQAVVVHQELGLFTSDEFDALTDLAEKAGAREFRTTRDQNLVIVGLSPTKVDEVVAQVRAMGFSVEDQPGSVPNVVSCPGTSTCAIGITNSQSFGGTIQDSVGAYEAKPNLSVKISGCQNGCGLHHVADFGFRGMGKKIGGRNAPHYQIYIGGHERENGHIGLAGPVVPARLAQESLDLLLAGYADGRGPNESVRDWALRIGKEGMTGLIKPVAAKVRGDDEGLFFDYGEDWEFTPPAGRTAECAAGIVDDDLQKDLADDALVNVDRALMAGAYDAAAGYGAEGFRFTAQRLRILASLPGNEDDTDEVIVSTIRTVHGGDAEVMAALDRIISARAQFGAPDGGKRDAEASTMREALAYWIDMVDEVIARPPALGGFEMGALGDSGGSVADMIKNAPGGGS